MTRIDTTDHPPSGWDGHHDDGPPGQARTAGSDADRPPAATSSRGPIGDGSASDDRARSRDTEPSTDPQPAQQPVPLGPDASVRQIARAARSAFLGRNLIQSGPPLWPFGRRAQARRKRNRHATEQARRGWAQFRDAFDAQPRTSAAPTAQRRPVDRRTNTIVIACLAGLVLVVVALAVWLDGPDPQPVDQPAASASTTAPAPASTTTPDSATTTDAAALSAPPPIPTGGVAPITPGPGTRIEPGSEAVVDPPVGDPTPAELASPDGAMRAWLARLCPFDYRQPFGTAERRARPAMTDTGWSTLDPGTDQRARASWDTTVAAREAGRCAHPDAHVSPEAPRPPTTAIVIGSVARVVTADGQRPYVEHLSEVRIVRRGADGLWRVDLATEGG